MKEHKETYLKQIRSDTAYPTYRGIIGVIVFLGYLLVILNLIAFIAAGFNGMQTNAAMGVLVILIGIVVSILGIVLIRYIKEVALMIADMVDSIIDANAKSSDSQDMI